MPSSTLWINGKHACDSTARIGTGKVDEAGNEGKFLIGFEMCLDEALPERSGGRGAIHVNKGDELKMTARINVDPKDDRAVIAGGEHRGQMALFYLPHPGQRRALAPVAGLALRLQRGDVHRVDDRRRH